MLTTKYKKKQPTFGLVCKDIFSKKCHIVPINEKNDTDDVYDAVMECFKVLG